MDLIRAVRLTLRDLGLHPGYTAATVLTLALAVGANAAIFSAVHGGVLKPSAIHEPDRLVITWERDPSRSPVIELSYRNFQDWATHNRSFSHAAAIGSSTWPVILDGRGESVRLSSACPPPSSRHWALSLRWAEASGRRTTLPTPNASSS